MSEPDLPTIRFSLAAEDQRRLDALRAGRPALGPEPARPSLGARIADLVARTVGSWRFIILQSLVLALWMAVNVVSTDYRWDPYRFILLNLALSFQAAYAAPIIMMSQNRQADKDRNAAAHDYEVNLRAELEILRLHEKVNHLIEQVSALKRPDGEQPR